MNKDEWENIYEEVIDIYNEVFNPRKKKNNMLW